MAEPSRTPSELQSGSESASPPISRRVVFTGLGLGAAGAAGAAFAQPAHAESSAGAEVRTCTIEELRALSNPLPDHVYFVLDPGQEGHFRYDPTDTESADNTGLVLVSSSGARFHRIFDGPIMIDWFGARPDYDPDTKEGTASDDALTLALQALEPFYYSNWPSPPGAGLPTIMFSAGNYLFTQPGQRITWARGVRGLHLAGQGMHQSNLYFDAPESKHGAANHFLINDGRPTSESGSVMGYWFSGLAFLSVTGQERFMLFADDRGGGVTTRMYFDQCHWNDFRVGLDIQGRVNTSQLRMDRCWIADSSEDQTFLLADNPQAQNFDFEACEYWNHGTMFRFIGGGNVHISGGQAYTFSEKSCFLRIDGEETVGVNNGSFNITDLNPEIRLGPLLRLDNPEAHVSFVNCRLSTPFAGYVSTTWSDGASYDAGIHVRAAYEEHVTIPTKQQVFVAKEAHIAGPDTRPRIGKDWRKYWSARYELEIDRGHVEIRGGRLAAHTRLGYSDDSADPTKRGSLKISDNCQLINPVADLVGFEPDSDSVGAGGRLPHVIATGCRPFSGPYPGAYGVTADEPVDVALNHAWGHEGALAPLNHYVFRASANAGEGLPSAADGEQEFLLPRGAHVVGVRLVTNHHADTSPSVSDYTVTNHDGTVTFLPVRWRPDRQVDSWYEIRTGAERVFKVTSTAADRLDGCFVVDYY